MLIVYLYQMGSRFKKGLIIVLVIIIALAIALPIANNYVEKKITSALEDMSEHIKVQIDDISVNVLLGSISLNTINLTVSGKTTKEANLEIKLKDVLVKKISYKNLIFDNKIFIKNIELNQPQITYYHTKVVEKKEHEKKDSVSKGQLIHIGALKINEGNITMLNKANDSLILKANSFSMVLNDITNTVYKKYNTPISFGNFDFIAQTIFLNAGKYENLQLGSIHANNHSVILKALEFKTKYSRFELSQIIKSERDHNSLLVDSVVINKMDLGFKTDSIFSFKAESTSIYKPIFNNFRDKLVADNMKSKSLYSKKIRDLNFDLTLNHINVLDGELVYEEKVNNNIVPGKIFFTELHINMENVSNTYNSGKAITKLITHAKFMGDAPLKTEWEFDVNDVNDSFVYKAELGLFNIGRMNQFMEPNMNIDIQGTLHKTFFTINGNSNTSSIDLKTNFDDFKITVLRKKERKKNKVLSAVANLVIKKSSKKGDNNYIEARKEGVVRDETKSVFNFIWLNVKAGLINAKH